MQNLSQIRSNRRTSGGFTLVELLVTIGIIVVLAGIALPLIVRSYRASERASVAADIQAIATALDAYHADHRDYPRATLDATYNEFSHARLLVRSLIAPADQTVDGHQGPGFRMRYTLDASGNLLSGGRVYGPYLQPDRFALKNPENPTEPDPLPVNLALFDRWDRPILYFPGALARPNIEAGENYVGSDLTQPSLYNALHNVRFFRGQGEGTANTNAVARIRVMLGDHNANGRIDDGETPAYTGPYILWSAGPDRMFGPEEVFPDASGPEIQRNAQNAARADDITNFTIGR